MNKLVSLLPIVLVVGLVGYILGGTAPAQSFTATSTPAGTIISPVPMGHSVSHPRDWVRLEHGVPYDVPTGKILVITAIGGASISAHYTDIQYWDGAAWVTEAETIHEPTSDGVSIHALPIGLAFEAGEQVRVMTFNHVTGRGWGYLVDA